jgi:hypothetical protein
VVLEQPILVVVVVVVEVLLAVRGELVEQVVQESLYLDTLQQRQFLTQLLEEPKPHLVPIRSTHLQHLVHTPSQPHNRYNKYKHFLGET